MMTRAAFAAALLCGVPAFAADTSVSPGNAAMTFAPADPGVETFYLTRGSNPLWLSEPAAAQALMAALHRAPLDGFAAGPEFAASVQAALQRASGGDASARMAADRLLSTAWVRYVRALRTPPAGMQFADPSLLPTPRDALGVLTQAASSNGLAEHVRSVSAVNPVYSSLRDAAWNEMQSTGAAPQRALLSSLERARFMPRGERYILIDAASAQLMMIENGQVRDTMKVIVGKSSSQTPMLASSIHYATINPYWNVPTDLARKLIAPRVVSEGMGYLKSKGYEVLSSYNEDAEIVDPKTIDWKAVADGRIEVRIRQRPGPTNSMGRVKFPFQNNAGIYLHDTPNKDLFEQNLRALSAGCVRLEDAERLAGWLMRREPRVATVKPETHVQLPQGVPIFLTHLSPQASGGALAASAEIFAADGESEGG